MSYRKFIIILWDHSHVCSPLLTKMTCDSARMCTCVCRGEGDRRRSRRRKEDGEKEKEEEEDNLTYSDEKAGLKGSTAYQAIRIGVVGMERKNEHVKGVPKENAGLGG